MNQTERFIGFQISLACFVFTPILFTTVPEVLFSRFTKIAEVKNYLNDEKRDIFNTFDTEDQNDKGVPIDPFDLMNRLKQSESMDNATTPSDALDEALRAFDSSEY